MTSDARNAILARRSTGVADMSALSPADGELNLAQALQANLFKTNCNHQAGIATETEVGLSADRFPVRVVLVPNASTDQPPAFKTDTVMSYWRVCNANGDAIPFSRKPIADTMPISRLRALVSDLDDRLWINFEAIRGNTSNDVLDPTQAVHRDALWAYLQVVAPTAEQTQNALASFNSMLAASVASRIAPMIRVGESAYVRGLPHGRSYRTIDGEGPDPVCFRESVLCVMINYTRMSARYEGMPPGTTLQAAYAVASMFRMGLYEAYESREYYTVYASVTDATNHIYQIKAVQAPEGYEAPTDLAVGSSVSMTAFRYSKKNVIIGNLLVLMSGLMHYLFNHTTGGTLATGALLSTLAIFGHVKNGMAREAQEQVTSLFYEALHPSNKRAIANILYKNAQVWTSGRCQRAPRAERIVLDSYLEIRMNPYPAGAHKAFVCLTALQRVLESQLAPFLPWAERIDSCITLCQGTLSMGAQAHIGAHYYTGNSPSIQSSTLDQFLPELAQFVAVFHKGDSLSQSPSLSPEMAKRSSAMWTNLLKAVKAEDISTASPDVVRRYLSSTGATHFQMDPNDEATWAPTMEMTRTALGRISGFFT